jgi:hypothetical protein
MYCISYIKQVRIRNRMEKKGEKENQFFLDVSSNLDLIT